MFGNKIKLSMTERMNDVNIIYANFFYRCVNGNPHTHTHCFDLIHSNDTESIILSSKLHVCMCV